MLCWFDVFPIATQAALFHFTRTEAVPVFHRRQFTPANFADCKAQTAIFEDIAAIDADRFYNLAGNAGTPERLSAEGVTHNLFSILGVKPALGRIFLPEEDTAGSEHVVLLSYRLWLSRFGGDRNVVGQTVLLDGEKYSVVGRYASLVFFSQQGRGPLGTNGFYASATR